ncbi:MAG: hypothetical protein LBQ18_03310 [Campylobacteraceae bacterium]|jgi:hypothetical protein|nr:hypothetical protein [Campylobacteraceae bacterium]
MSKLKQTGYPNILKDKRGFLRCGKCKCYVELEVTEIVGIYHHFSCTKCDYQLVAKVNKTKGKK